MNTRLLKFAAIALLVFCGIVAWEFRNALDGQDDGIAEEISATLTQHLVTLPEPIDGGRYPAAETFVQLLSPDRGVRRAAINDVTSHWQLGNAAMLLETSRLLRRGMPNEFVAALENETGQRFGGNSQAWYDYLWNQPVEEHPQHASFKAALYSRIDPRFAEYFDDAYASTIRLDEIMWGGVVRDGIPPLKNPKMLAADKATYLSDSDIVFGIAINGDFRAYPKRILAWHEMFKDTIGGTSVNGVYCTLCGSMIVYETEFEGTHHELGTSGFLYRSNKLMYDHATKSMWSTLNGQPVVGPLVGQGINLKRLHVVTTSWGEWRRRHPATTVLSLDTGHRRDYGEGVAYRDYFATDRLMFRVPFHDQRLKNKQQVLALRFDSEPAEQLAIDTEFLQRNPVYHGQLGEQRFVVLTDRSGANRVYDPGKNRFVTWNLGNEATGEDGGAWQVTEAELADGKGNSCPRLPAHRAFWFGWHAAYPETALVH
ncbi:MAG: DUF3179 domain-containing protein [Planctomycetota bacterium]